MIVHGKVQTTGIPLIATGKIFDIAIIDVIFFYRIFIGYNGLFTALPNDWQINNT